MTEPVETELVARLRERLEKATPAPWEACVPGDYGDFDGDSRVMCGDDKRIAVFHWNERYAEGNDADIELSVALRNAAPALLDEIERLRAELARVRKLGEAMAEDAAVRISQADMERATKAVKSAGIERARIAPQPPRHLYAIAPGEPIRKPARKGRG